MRAAATRYSVSSSERSIQAVFSCTVQPLRQQVGGGLVVGLVGQRKDGRAVRATASRPATSTRTMSSALGGVVGASFRS